MILSVCIPTHDGRAPHLRNALDSVLAQLTGELRDKVEISISDNASQDGTSALVADYQERFGAERIRYKRHERDQGYLRNFISVIDQAQGEYCWLMGSDDTFVEGAVAGIVDLLERHPDTTGVSINRQRVDFRWPDQIRTDPEDELPDDPTHEHVYRSMQEAFRQCGLALDFMSTQVVRRRGWQQGVADMGLERLDRSVFAHMLIIGAAIRRHPVWAWYPEPVVRQRTGTSAFDEALDHHYGGYQMNIMRERSIVWAELVGKNSPAWRSAMTKAYRRTANPYATARYKMEAVHTWRTDLAMLRAWVGHFYWLPEFWLKTFPVLLMPHGLGPRAKRLSELTDRVTGHSAPRRL